MSAFNPRILWLGAALWALGSARGAWAQPTPAPVPAPPVPPAPVATQPAASGQDDDLRRRVERLERAQRAEAERLRRENAELLQRVEDLESEQASAAAEAEEKRRQLHISGWFDFGFNWVPSVASRSSAFYGHVQHSPTFVLGNIDLIFDARLSEQWRVLFEPRFTFAPDGIVEQYEIPGFSTHKRITTAIVDPATGTGLVHWGGVSIDRLWLAWEPRDWFKVRAGSFLTPYGNWNQDHGTPVIIPIRPPLLVSLQILPPRLTGFELYGSLFRGQERLDYALHVSNGRGPLANGDLDDNKGIGGRLAIASSRFGELQLGAAFFIGRYTDSKATIDPTVTVQPPILPRTENVPTIQFDEYDFSCDLRWQYRSFELQAEAAYSVVKFSEGLRPVQPVNPIFNFALGQDTAPLADYGVLGTYLLLVYKLPRIELRPFIDLSWTDVNTNVEYDNGIHFSLGLNYRPLPSLSFKLQYQFFHLINDPDFTTNAEYLSTLSRDINVLATQMAVKF